MSWNDVICYRHRDKGVWNTNAPLRLNSCSCMCQKKPAFHSHIRSPLIPNGLEVQKPYTAIAGCSDAAAYPVYGFSSHTCMAALRARVLSSCVAHELTCHIEIPICLYKDQYPA